MAYSSGLHRRLEQDRVVLRGRLAGLLGGVTFAILLGACQPTVRVEPPKEPITINLNIKLDADVRVRLEERAKEDIQRNPGIF